MRRICYGERNRVEVETKEELKLFVRSEEMNFRNVAFLICEDAEPNDTPNHS